MLGWSGGNSGNPNSLITPANISSLSYKYAEVVDGLILAEPVSATVDVTVGSNPGIQTVVFVATEHDTLYASIPQADSFYGCTTFSLPVRPRCRRP